MTTTASTYPITLLAAGSNARGQLGIGSTDDAHTFTPCVFKDHGPHLPTNTTRILGLASGSSHTVILLQYQDGMAQLWGAGDGTRGQLGPDHNAQKAASEDESLVFRPLAIPFGELFQQKGLPYRCRLVAAAWETTYLVLSCDGRSDILISMGSNDFGALGGGENLNAANKARIVNLAAALGDKASGSPSSTLSVGSLHAGPRHVVVELQTYTVEGITLSPVLVGWGSSRQGQLGEKAKASIVSRPALIPIDIATDPVRCCALGNEHTVVLHGSNRISVLGSNRKSQLDGLTSLQMPIEKIGCTWNGTYVHTREGIQDILLAAGSNAKGQLGRTNTSAVSNSNAIGNVKLPTEPTTRIIKLACGSEHVLVSTSPSGDVRKSMSDSVWGWGWNEHGNLGLGTLEDVTLPVRIWPRDGANPTGNVVDVWAACGTSWLALSSQ
ncbi:regulator of chromosome condensation 1/beta-lactamase-inhibitor protein II [Pisolithus marmoratus]|nr:regulator of chromosome condensation 1/beta-lactamase-inhibitor protein II [Pisolithus marmoratus]